jgi:hypothetical protein
MARQIQREQSGKNHGKRAVHTVSDEEFDKIMEMRLRKDRALLEKLAKI